METSFDDNLRASLPVMESAVKMTVSALGAAYAAGLLITTVYFGIWSLPAPDLRDARFVLVGSLWLSFVAATATMLAMTKAALRESLLAIRGRRFSYAVTMFGTAIAPGLILWLAIELLSGLATTVQRTLAVAVIFIASALSVTALVKHGARVVIWLRTGDYSQPLEAYTELYGCVFLVVLIGVELTGYAAFTYSAFSRTVGGGRPTPVLLVPAPGSASVYRTLGIQMHPNGFAGPTRILSEDDHCYYLQMIGTIHRAVRIDKRFVGGVLQQGGELAKLE